MIFYYLLAAAAVSSFIGSVAGIGGGILLLASLSYLVVPTAIVPIHGAVQAASCLTRVTLFKDSIKWRVATSFYLGLLPGTVVSAFLLKSFLRLNPHAILILIAVYIMYFLFRQEKAVNIVVGDNSQSIVVVGFLCGVLGMIVGSTGPIVSAWLLKNNIVKDDHIATKSAMQLIANLTKVIMFVTVLGFPFMEYTSVLIWMFITVVAFTYLGKRALGYLSDSTFAVMVKVILFAVAINILMNELPKLLAGV